MGWTLGGRREIRLLHEYVGADETVSYIAQGAFGEHQGVAVLTDQRLLFIFNGWVNKQIEDFPLNRITAVNSNSGLATGTLIVHTGGAIAEISSIIKSDLKYFVAALRRHVAEPPTISRAAPQEGGTELIDQIRKLGELRDMGILTDDEFEAKKADLLKRV